MSIRLISLGVADIGYNTNSARSEAGCDSDEQVPEYLPT